MELNNSIKNVFEMRFFFIFLMISSYSIGQDTGSVDKKLFVYGGQVNKEFIKYTASLTGKENPKICFLPTATGDNIKYINFWYELCADIKVEPHVLKVWVNSYQYKQSFEEILLDMDAIIVGGGNTLNMLAIWKAQKIDIALVQVLYAGLMAEPQTQDPKR